MRIGSLALLLFLGLAAMARTALADIAVDGRLDEPEWQTARRFDAFLTADPLSLEQPAHRTEALVIARPAGLYVGIVSRVPRGLRTYGQSPRDARSMDADSVTIVVDFEGQGKSAYEFTVSLSNSQRDGFYLNQTKVSYDWDGTWHHAVSEDDDAWYVEALLPWSLAQLSTSVDQKRQIGLWFIRYIKALGRGYAFPPIESTRASFLADLERIEVPGYTVQTFDWFPYAAASRDLLADSSHGRAGFDLFWKPNAQHQLALTFNPDFAQVETDDLVVNYTAIETFFTEKRPFFTEGQSLFDLRLTNEARLINTRRIGAAPDVGPEGISDILGAAKFTGLSGPLEYGAFAAVEDDSSEAQGRTFVAARSRYKLGDTTFGYLGSFTHRPTLERDAQVHVMDGSWAPQGGVAITGQLIGTWIDQTAADANGLVNEHARGTGAVVSAGYSPGGRFQQDVNLTWLDREFDIDDLGYMQRGNLRELQSVTQVHTRQFASDSILSAAYWRINGRLKYNDYGDRLPATMELGRYWRFKVPAGIYLYYYGQTSGIDDLVTFGNGNVRLPARHELGAQYQADVRRRLSLTGEAYVFQEGLDGTAWRLALRPSYTLAENLNLGVEIDYIDSPDWLIWRSLARRLATHERQQLNTLLKLSWYPTARQELRIKAQWIALRARVRQGYSIDANADLTRDDVTPIEDFSLGQLGLQVRYRYELKPLSDLHIVYSRGGFDSRDDYAGSLSPLFADALDSRTASLVLVKLRYRF